jgi:hypothetical protein
MPVPSAQQLKLLSEKVWSQITAVPSKDECIVCVWHGALPAILYLALSPLYHTTVPHHYTQLQCREKLHYTSGRNCPGGPLVTPLPELEPEIEVVSEQLGIDGGISRRCCGGVSCGDKGPTGFILIPSNWRCGAVQCSAVQCSAVQCRALAMEGYEYQIRRFETRERGLCTQTPDCQKLLSEMD